MNIVFMGTPDFALTILKELDLEYGVKLIVAQPDKPTGRKKEIVFNPVKQFAVNKNINILQPERIKGNSEFVRELLDISPDIIYVAAYGKILSEEILKIPKYGCINIHASLLPKYRGAAPINWALINGDNETGITLMKMDAGMDTGDIISSHKINIEDDDNVESLSNKLANLGAKKLIDFTATLIKKDKYGLVKQNNSEASLAPKIKKEDGLINWNQSSMEIRNLVNGCNPWPIAFTNLDEKIVKIFKVEIVKENDIKPGGIYNSGGKLVVGCGKGCLEIIEVQRSGQKRMPGKDFLNGIKKIENLCFT